jgi:hypothetical protein
MILTFAQDFTSIAELDTQLMGSPDSGLYWNRGTHPIVTISNIVDMLPLIDFTFAAYSALTTYGKFENSRKKSDLVTYESKIYQSLTETNSNHTPSSSPTYWLETNIDSIRMKAFIWNVEDNFLSELSLNRKLIENQYIYNVGKTLRTLSNDYSGWCFEPKGSDYVKIRINQIALQANTATPQNLYVINQGQLLTTLTLNPNNGILSFEDIPYTISGKGKFYFIIDSQEVLTDNAFNDPLKYNGFVCYPVNGIGATPQVAEYSENSFGNGLNFNVSVYLDSSVYINNNKIDFAKFLQSQFEYDLIRMILNNSNNRSNTNQRNLISENTLQLLATEALNIDLNTIARKYNYQKKVAIDAINRTFDRFLNKETGLKIKRGVI